MKRLKSMGIRAFLVVLATCCSSGAAGPILVANFDSGKKPNNIGGDFGAWGKDPKDRSQFAKEAFDKNNTRDGVGYCMKIMYDVDSPNIAYNGFWMRLKNLDVSECAKLVFWAKADADAGCAPRFKLELKSDEKTMSFYVSKIGKEWRRIEVPLSAFDTRNNLKSLHEFVIVFEDHTSRPKSGILYIDDVSFE